MFWQVHLFMYFHIIPDILLKTYTLVNEVKGAINSVEDEVQLLKAAVIQNVPEDDRDEVFQVTQHQSEESFENFCERLEENGYRKLFVSSVT